jgi:hypothetical protein
MRIVYQRCCGMDVHKNSITACLMLIDDDGEFRTYKREFGTMTRDLKAMSCWLESEGVEAVAMEATGVYWKPVWNILEAANKFTLVLVNAQHIKNVPGRKTDRKIANGLPSFCSMVSCRQALCRPERSAVPHASAGQNPTDPGKFRESNPEGIGGRQYQTGLGSQ